MEHGRRKWRYHAKKGKTGSMVFNSAMKAVHTAKAIRVFCESVDCIGTLYTKLVVRAAEAAAGFFESPGRVRRPISKNRP